MLACSFSLKEMPTLQDPPFPPPPASTAVFTTPVPSRMNLQGIVNHTLPSFLQV